MVFLTFGWKTGGKPVIRMLRHPFAVAEHGIFRYGGEPRHTARSVADGDTLCLTIQRRGNLQGRPISSTASRDDTFLTGSFEGGRP